jgi:hypothetical protein
MLYPCRLCVWPLHLTHLYETCYVPEPISAEYMMNLPLPSAASLLFICSSHLSVISFMFKLLTTFHLCMFLSSQGTAMHRASEAINSASATICRCSFSAHPESRIIEQKAQRNSLREHFRNWKLPHLIPVAKWSGNSLPIAEQSTLTVLPTVFAFPVAKGLSLSRLIDYPYCDANHYREACLPVCDAVHIGPCLQVFRRKILPASSSHFYTQYEGRTFPPISRNISTRLHGEPSLRQKYS